MPFYLSPSVNVTETDLTTIVPAVATSIGATVGTFPWGPVLEPVTLASENDLVRIFGKPTENVSNFTAFFTAANYLSYSNNLVLVRADVLNLKNAVVTPDAGMGVKIRNVNHYLDQYVNGGGTVGAFAAKYPGVMGNSLKVSVADVDSFSAWAYKNEFDSTPGTSDYASRVGGSKDELHIIVIDEDGLFTGTKGSILEKFSAVSKASDSIKFDGTKNYYKEVINTNSKYIWWMDHVVEAADPLEAWGQPAAGVTFDTITTALNYSLSGGVDAYDVTDGELIAAFDMFKNADLIDVSLIMCGKASPTVSEHVLVNIAELRKDCVTFISPQNVATAEPIVGDESSHADMLIAYRNELPSSSYGFLDSGYKYQYDRYNDKYRWIPLNGDIAGLCARTDYTNDPWWSPAGYNRGIIKNVVKLAHNPSKTLRDKLFPAGVNFVINEPGNGPVLLGDKTLQAKPSAFDAINVRRLFIVLEKAIATAAKYSLYEFNDAFTRAQFKNMIEPFLRGVQGRRGLTEFLVKCDDTNNTGEIIDSNQFVADIYLKPARAIRYIQLSFIATRTGVSFDELGA